MIFLEVPSAVHCKSRECPVNVPRRSNDMKIGPNIKYVKENDIQYNDLIIIE